MTKEFDLELLRRKWIEAFQVASAFFTKGHRRGGGWEGIEVCRELSRVGSLSLVSPQPGDNDRPFIDLTKELFREVRTYKRCEGQIVSTDRCFRDAIDILRAVEERLDHAAIEDSSAKEYVASVLSKLASTVKRNRQKLETTAKTYLENALIAAPSERATWPIFFDNNQNIQSIPPLEIEQMKSLYGKHEYPEKIRRRIELDARFQVRAARILRSYLQRDMRVSLTTISRLVVLTYICAGLASVKDQRLTIEGTNKTITVSGVDQRLRQAGLK